MNLTLRESVDGLQTAYVDPDRRGAIEFVLEPCPDMAALRECILELALTGDQPVVPHAADVPVKSVMAALVSHRVGIGPEGAFQGRFTDDLLVALPDALRPAKFSRILIETPVEEPPSTASADHRRTHHT